MIENDQFQKLLRKSQEGKHTILCEMDNAFADYLDKGPIVSVYAFPGTQENTPEGIQVALYLPFASKVTYAPLEMLRPIKKTKWMPKRFAEVQNMREVSIQKQNEMRDCLEQLITINPSLVMGIQGLLQGIENLNSMEEEIYKTAHLLIDESIKAIGEHPFLIELKSGLDRFKEYVDHRDKQLVHMQEVHETLERFEKTHEQLPKMSEEEAEKIRDIAKGIFQKELGLSEEEIRDVVHVRVLTTAMFAAQCEHEFFTYDEIITAVQKYRPEIAQLPHDAVIKGIQNGIEKAQQGVGQIVPPALIEKNVMEQFSLTEVGNAFAYQTLRSM